jgi:hypothetical protein
MAAPIPKSLKKKTVSLEGRWQLASMNYNGQPLNGGNSTQIWSVIGEELSIEDGPNGVRRNNGVNYKMVKVEGDGDNCVDWTIEYTNARVSNYVYRGRVKFEQDGFDFVFSTNGRDAGRPETVEPGPNRYLYSFKRIAGDK